ncbi:MAG: hypothetical protein BWY68_00423 [bacterium ADurb.Bin400]|nr:MAG: hypothetical protein BWY68_00423 [bacterium ADurb.Bin400]
MERESFDWRVVDGVVRRCSNEIEADAKVCFMGPDSFAVRVTRVSSEGRREFTETPDISIMYADYGGLIDFSNQVLQRVMDTVTNGQFRPWPD